MLAVCSPCISDRKLYCLPSMYNFPISCQRPTLLLLSIVWKALSVRGIRRRDPQQECSAANNAKSSGYCKGGGGVGNRRIEFYQAVHVCHAQSLLHHAVGASDVQGAPGFFKPCVAHDDDADAGAVEHGDMAQVENHLFAIFLEQFIEFPFYSSGVVAEDDSAIHL